MDMGSIWAIPRFHKSAVLLTTTRNKLIKFLVGFCVSLKFRRGLSVKLGVTLIKIKWGLAGKVEVDFVRWGFVPPKKLWYGLWNYNILSNRQLRVVLDGKSSHEYPVNAGVRQGPFLDFPKDFICNSAIYSDDTTFFSNLI